MTAREEESSRFDVLTCESNIPRPETAAFIIFRDLVVCGHLNAIGNWAIVWNLYGFWLSRRSDGVICVRKYQRLVDKEVEAEGERGYVEARADLPAGEAKKCNLGFRLSFRKDALLKAGGIEKTFLYEVVKGWKLDFLRRRRAKQDDSILGKAYCLNG